MPESRTEAEFWDEAPRLAAAYRDRDPVLIYECLKALWRLHRPDASRQEHDTALRRIIDISGV